MNDTIYTVVAEKTTTTVKTARTKATATFETKNIFNLMVYYRMMSNRATQSTLHTDFTPCRTLNDNRVPRKCAQRSFVGICNVALFG